MTQIEVSSTVAADASSLALVLAGPAARELWPQPGPRAVAPVSLPAPTQVSVDPPTRTGVGFSARARVLAGDDCVASGRLLISPAANGCELTLVLTAHDGAPQTLRRDAGRYLDNVARAGRERSSAA